MTLQIEIRCAGLRFGLGLCFGLRFRLRLATCILPRRIVRSILRGRIRGVACLGVHTSLLFLEQVRVVLEHLCQSRGNLEVRPHFHRDLVLILHTTIDQGRCGATTSRQYH